jgi:hypothetical protein
MTLNWQVVAIAYIAISLGLLAMAQETDQG